MQNSSFDLIGIGECLVEFAEVRPREFRQDYSGDVLNALWMASRLGLRTGLVSTIGNDPFTEDLLEVLAEAGIDAACAARATDRPNGIYYVLDREGEPRLHFLRKGSAATQTFQPERCPSIEAYMLRSRFVLFSAIPLAILEHRKNFLEVLASVSGKIAVCFDTNVRPALWADLAELRALIEQIAPLVSVLFVSQEDDLRLFGERSAEAAIEHYASIGYRRVVLRRGAASTITFDRDYLFEVPTVASLHVVDATGAGDAFNAGFIAAQCRGASLETSVAFGNAAAASVLGVAGGRAGAVSRVSIERTAAALLRKHQA